MSNELLMDVKTLIAEIGEIDNPEDIGLDQNLVTELGLDSMLLLEILSCLEQKFEISIPETEFPNMATPYKCAEVVSRYLM